MVENQENLRVFVKMRMVYWWGELDGHETRFIDSSGISSHLDPFFGPEVPPKKVAFQNAPSP